MIIYLPQCGAFSTLVPCLKRTSILIARWTFMFWSILIASYCFQFSAAQKGFYDALSAYIDRTAHEAATLAVYSHLLQQIIWSFPGTQFNWFTNSSCQVFHCFTLRPTRQMGITAMKSEIRINETLKTISIISSIQKYDSWGLVADFLTLYVTQEIKTMVFNAGFH